MVLFEHLFCACVATRTFPCWEMMDLSINIGTNNRTEEKRDHKDGKNNQ